MALVRKLPKLIISLLFIFGSVSCNRQGEQNDDVAIFRFEKELFNIPANAFNEWRQEQPELIQDFSRAFTEYIIRTGPDTLPESLILLDEFTSDPVIMELKRMSDSLYGQEIADAGRLMGALEKFTLWTGGENPPQVLTYLSGFNQSFVTLSGLLGIGLDHYLGKELVYYQDLGFPKYLIDLKEPAYLVPDALRAWILSELQEPGMDATLLDHMVFHGKIMYLLGELLPGMSHTRVFRYREGQLDWLKTHEKAMWNHLARESMLFTKDRMAIRRLIEEAPFTRDYGNESPGRAGCWLGYRIVARFMKKSGLTPPELIKTTDSRLILEKAQYKP